MHWSEKYKIPFSEFMCSQKELVAKIETIPENFTVENLMVDIFIRLTRRFEKVFYGGDDNPLPHLMDGMDWLSKEIDSINTDFEGPEYKTNISRGVLGFAVPKQEAVHIETANFYETFFRDYDIALYDEAVDFTKQRHERNDIEYSWFKGKVGLDAGCGSGRYTIAYSRLGAKQMYGLDNGEGALLNATSILGKLGIKNVSFVTGDCLALHFEDDYFDFVLSHGVLHHTSDTELGLKEVFRVLKSGGFLWLQLYGDGLFWRVNDIFRALAKKISYSLLVKRMQDMGFNPNRIFIFLDNAHVPICNVYTWDQAEALVKSLGFKVVKRLLRDVRTDNYISDNEQIAMETPYADLRWGEGSVKLLLQKP